MTDRAELSGLRERLAHVQPRSLRFYLLAAGWQRGEAYSRGHLWRYPTGDGPYEAYQPGDPNVRDYVNRVTDLIETIAIVESRTPSAVMDDLEEVGFEVQYFQLRPSAPMGTIPIWNFKEALEGIWLLNISTAYTELVSADALVQPKKKPRRIYDVARSALVGQSRPGSYVISVRAPQPHSMTGSDVADQVEIDRRVASRLEAGIKDAHTLASGDATIEFAVSAKLSANFLEALAVIGGSGDNRLSFKVAPGWPPPVGPWADRPAVLFDLAHVDALRESASRIRELSRSRIVTVDGYVAGANLTDENGRGGVQLRGTASGGSDRRLRIYSIELPSDLYAHAIEAQRRNSRVRVQGELIADDFALRIVGVREFTIRGS